MSIEEFKSGIDYRDICYMIDHVNILSTRCDVIEKLGYRVGVDIISKDCGTKNVRIGKNGEFRVQISAKDKNVGLAKCAIVEYKKKNK